MSLKDFSEYKKREFCNDIGCPIQIRLNRLKIGSDEYENVHRVCKTDCKFSAWQFHHWLMKKGYLILKHKNI